MEKPLISIIVPVYGVERELPRCIDSILTQDFTDFELLLIDDGSPDRCGEICDEYAAKDSRLRVFHKQNGGVSSARNVGLDNARGEWVMFVDSDDVLLSNSLKYTVDAINDIDGREVFIVFNLLYNSQPIVQDHETNFTTDQYISCCLRYKVHIGPYAKLFKREKMGSLRFNVNLKIGEDLLFIIEYLVGLGNSAVIQYCHQPVYNYIQRDGSAMKSDKASQEYIRLNEYAVPVLQGILKEKYKEAISQFEAINTWCSFYRKRSKPTLAQEQRLYELSKLIKSETIDPVLTKYLQLLNCHLLFSRLYLWYRYRRASLHKFVRSCLLQE